jgi:hypothetical protein
MFERKSARRREGNENLRHLDSDDDAAIAATWEADTAAAAEMLGLARDSADAFLLQTVHPGVADTDGSSSWPGGPRPDASLALAPSSEKWQKVDETFWRFPPRHAFPFTPPPVERPRRYKWALMGQLGWGGRKEAVAAFEQILGTPFRAGLGMQPFAVMRTVISDAIFVPVGGGYLTFETSRGYDAARCGAIPVVVNSVAKKHQPWRRDVDTAYATLLGFEGQYPDGWIVAPSWTEAATRARRILETPGEVVRLRRLAMHSYNRVRHAIQHQVRVGLEVARSGVAEGLWDAGLAELARVGAAAATEEGTDVAAAQAGEAGAGAE